MPRQGKRNPKRKRGTKSAGERRSANAAKRRELRGELRRVWPTRGSTQHGVRSKVEPASDSEHESDGTHLESSEEEEWYHRQWLGEGNSGVKAESVKAEIHGHDDDRGYDSRHAKADAADDARHGKPNPGGAASSSREPGVKPEDAGSTTAAADHGVPRPGKSVKRDRSDSRDRASGTRRHERPGKAKQLWQ